MTLTTCIRATALSMTTAAAFLLGVSAASAQIAARVNGQPITSYEVEQRMKIKRTVLRQNMSRQAALNEAIDDRLKVQEANRVGYRLTEAHIDEQVARLAKTNNKTVPEFAQALAQAGIDLSVYRQMLLATYSWELTMERRNKTGDAQHDSIFQDSRGGTGRVIDYTLNSVIFVVPRGTGAGGRMAEARSARARFNDCRSGLDMLRQLRDVAVKPPVRRASNQLSPQLAKILAATPSNRLTQPFPSDQGIEMIAVCERTERGGRVLSEAEQKAADSKKQQDEATFLKSLRSKATITR